MPEPEQKPVHAEVPYTAPYYSSLLAGLIHKLNNVTTVLTGNAGLLLMGEKLPRDTRESLEQMTEAIDQLAQTLNEAAIACKGSKVNLSTVDLAPLISAIESPVEIELSHPEKKRVIVKSDPDKLRAILHELSRNAASAGASKITCKLEPAPAGNYLIRFRDNGSGIKKELMPRIFDPFFTVRRYPDGFGLGLFRVAGELSRIEGNISIESDGKSFTEVRILLPGAIG
jgi:two-component system, cell cycle sensor histidine kinase and response regulator CckA